jgi:hypothetical protein
MNTWSELHNFSDPTQGGCLCALFGLGAYGWPRKRTGSLILFGRSQNVAYRMSSLLPAPRGCGTRSNNRKQSYVCDFLPDIEYRTKACADETQAMFEEELRRCKGGYLFAT